MGRSRLSLTGGSAERESSRIGPAMSASRLRRPLVERAPSTGLSDAPRVPSKSPSSNSRTEKLALTEEVSFPGRKVPEARNLSHTTLADSFLGRSEYRMRGLETDSSSSLMSASSKDVSLTVSLGWRNLRIFQLAVESSKRRAKASGRSRNSLWTSRRFSFRKAFASAPA